MRRTRSSEPASTPTTRAERGRASSGGSTGGPKVSQPSRGWRDHRRVPERKKRANSLSSQPKRWPLSRAPSRRTPSSQATAAVSGESQIIAMIGKVGVVLGVRKEGWRDRGPEPIGGLTLPPSLPNLRPHPPQEALHQRFGSTGRNALCPQKPQTRNLAAPFPGSSR